MSDTKHLEEAIDDLRSQISALAPDDEATRRHLSALMGDIERRVGGPAIRARRTSART